MIKCVTSILWLVATSRVDRTCSRMVWLIWTAAVPTLQGWDNAKPVVLGASVVIWLSHLPFGQEDVKDKALQTTVGFFWILEFFPIGKVNKYGGKRAHIIAHYQ